MQPVIVDEHGIHRFKENKIVSWLLDVRGPKSLNDIALQGFPREDEEQFAQLIGYSVSGACDLSYMSADVCNAAFKESCRIREASSKANLPPRRRAQKRGRRS
jgi:hypothetical protein